MGRATSRAPKPGLVPHSLLHARLSRPCLQPARRWTDRDCPQAPEVGTLAQRRPPESGVLGSTSRLRGPASPRPSSIQPESRDPPDSALEPGSSMSSGRLRVLDSPLLYVAPSFPSPAFPVLSGPRRGRGREGVQKERIDHKKGLNSSAVVMFFSLALCSALSHRHHSCFLSLSLLLIKQRLSFGEG